MLLFRDKRPKIVGEDEYSELMLPNADNVKLDKDTVVAAASEADEAAGVPGVVGQGVVPGGGGLSMADDPEYWKNVLGEATINAVLEKMVSRKLKGWYRKWQKKWYNL